MKMILKRLYKQPLYTIGKLYIDDTPVCDTLEDTDRGLDSNMSVQEIQKYKIYGQTAIPYGIYNIDMNTVSPKFRDRSWAKTFGGKLPRLLNVKGFEGVLIHVGNTCSDTLGCILVGQSKGNGRLVGSISCFNRVMNLLLKAKVRNESITLEII